jgi:hypothetical protein
VLPPATIASALRSAAPFPGGPTFDLFCQAVAQSVTVWLPTGVSLTGVTSGLLGAGTVTGTLAFTSTPALVLAALSGTYSGPITNLLATVLSVGLNTGLLGLTYTGVSVGVATGLDTSRVISANGTTLAQVLRTTHAGLCAAQSGGGSVVPGFYEALANGIVTVILTGTTIPPTGVVAPTGPVGVASGVGTSTSIPV